jgi:hypothetical protein
VSDDPDFGFVRGSRQGPISIEKLLSTNQTGSEDERPAGYYYDAL